MLKLTQRSKYLLVVLTQIFTLLFLWGFSRHFGS
jgi:hypothetical protein